MRSETLYCKEGNSDKVYTVTLEAVMGNITVTGFSGRRGGTMIARPKYSGRSVEAAEEVYAKLLREKLAGGYKPGADAPKMQTPACKTPTANDYRPMLLNAITDPEPYLHSDGWLMQEKHDGVRAVLHVTKTAVKSFSRTDHDVVIGAEAERTLRKYFARCILDTEVVGDIVYVFDLLSHYDVDLRGYTTEQRDAGLEGLFDGVMKPGVNYVFHVQSYRTEAEKRKHLKAMHERGAEGVVFKRAEAKYSAGRPSSGGAWLKLKFKASCTVRVIAIGRDGKESVDVALADGRRVASVSTIGRKVPPVGSVIEVEYLYAHRNGGLVQPVYKAIRTDKAEADTADDLQYKGEAR